MNHEQILTVHATVLLATLLMGVVAVATGKGRPRPGPAKCFCWNVLPVLSVGVIFSLTLNIGGTPWSQWLLPAFSAGLAGMFMRDARARRILVAALTLTATGLCCHFLSIVQSDHVTGSPRACTALHKALTDASLRSIRQNVMAQVGSEEWFPAGFLEELLPSVSEPLLTRVEVLPCWHSPLSGLYIQRQVKLRVWYPGGKVKSTMGCLELRDQKRGAEKGAEKGDFSLERADEARHAFFRALELDPEDVRARYNLSFVLEHEKDYVSALRIIAEALALDRSGAYREGLLRKQGEVLQLVAQRFHERGQRMVNRVTDVARPLQIQAQPREK